MLPEPTDDGGPVRNGGKTAGVSTGVVGQPAGDPVERLQSGPGGGLADRQVGVPRLGGGPASGSVR